MAVVVFIIGLMVGAVISGIFRTKLDDRTLDLAYNKGYVKGAEYSSAQYTMGYEHGLHHNGLVIQNFREFKGIITAHAFCPLKHTIPIFDVTKQESPSDT